jgi:hypothetical protein
VITWRSKLRLNIQLHTQHYILILKQKCSKTFFKVTFWDTDLTFHIIISNLLRLYYFFECMCAHVSRFKSWDNCQGPEFSDHANEQKKLLAYRWKVKQHSVSFCNILLFCLLIDKLFLLNILSSICRNLRTQQMSVLVLLCTSCTTCFGPYWWPSSGGL